MKAYAAFSAFFNTLECETKAEKKRQLWKATCTGTVNLKAF